MWASFAVALPVTTPSRPILACRSAMVPMQSKAGIVQLQLGRHPGCIPRAPTTAAAAARHRNSSRRTLVLVTRATAGPDDVFQQLEKSQQAMAAAFDLLRQNASTSASSSASSPAIAPANAASPTAPGSALDNAAREDALWQRQEALWAREMVRWDDERAAWGRKEAALQGQVDQLRAVVLELAAQQAQLAQALAAARLSSGGGGGAGGGIEVEYTGGRSGAGSSSSMRAQGYAVEAPPTPEQLTAGSSAAVAAATANSSTAAAAAAREGSVSSSTTPAAAAAAAGGQQQQQDEGVPQAAWAGLFEGLPGMRAAPSDGDADAVAAASISQQLAAAVAAVDEGDVLQDKGPLSPASSSATASSPSFSSVMSESGSSSSAPAAPAMPSPSASSPAAASAPSASATTSTAASSSSSGGGGGVSVGSALPTLVKGDDDIQWVQRMQGALMERGYFCGDEEMEDWYFGEQTLSALLTFQSCEGIPETGVTCDPTWRALLGEAAYARLSADPSTSSSDAAAAAGGIGAEATRGEADGNRVELNAWPVLQEGEGGRMVHALHVLLEERGCWPGDDDYEWWWFGSATLGALRTFQSCSGLPESGVTCERTWVMLMSGEDGGGGAHPSKLNDLWSGGKYDDDLAAERKGVYLMGEQRWEDPSRLQRLREKMQREAEEEAAAKAARGE